MAPSLLPQGPDPDSQSGEGTGSRHGGGLRSWSRPLIVAGAGLAGVSLAAWAATLALAAGGGTAPPWITALALYGLPLAFVLMAAAIVGAVLERRRR